MGNIVEAFVTSFIFVSTGENYNELVYPAMKTKFTSLLYFEGAILLGMFCIIPICIQRFEGGKKTFFFFVFLIFNFTLKSCG